MGLHKVPSPRRRRRPFDGGTDIDELALSFRIDEQVDSSSDDKFDLDFLCIPFRNADTARLNIFLINYMNYYYKTTQFCK